MNTVAITDMTPRQAILAAMHGRAQTARQITGRLTRLGYRWPTNRRVTYANVTYDRVYSTLSALEREGLVEKLANPYDNGHIWRVKT